MTFPSSPSGESEMPRRGTGGKQARRSPAPPPAAAGRPAQRRGAGPAGPGAAPWRPARRAALLGARNTSGFCGCCGDTAQCAGWERNAPLPQQKRWGGILSANCTPPARPPGPGGGKRPREFQPEALVESTTAASHRTETPFNRADAKRHSAGCEALASAAKCVFLWTSAQGKTAGRLTFSIRYKAQCQ